MTIRKRKPAQPSYEPRRKLSPWRVMLFLLIIAGIVSGSFFGGRHWRDAQADTSDQPWFAAYVDVTSTPTFAFDQIGATEKRDAVLSFVVSSTKNPCTPAWGNAYSMDQAGASLDLDRRIARLQQQGGHVAVSFGGLKNDELAVKCTDEEKLYDAYNSVIERYNIDTIDLDLESQNLKDKEAGERRAKVLAKLQSDRRSKGKKLAIWVTLPVTPQGLSEDGTNGVASLLAGKVDLAGLNVMTMDYGQSKPKEVSMLTASENALTNSVRQLGILYSNAGVHLNQATLWSKIGATPMIGQNDIEDEVFKLEDADGLNKFARSKGAGRMSMWSANRDKPCGSNYLDTKVVSDSCSGVTEEKFSFSKALGFGFDGNLSSSAGIVTAEDPNPTVQEKDDPATSPYQIWAPEGAYLEGTKVVWHKNVYKAKWWTQNDMPDDPVLQTYETPWELVGPVLPGEKLIVQSTLPPGTYPDWSGEAVYDAGQRILFNGIPFQAKWWNKGESPAAASSNASGSPWVLLTQAQINELQSR